MDANVPDFETTFFKGNVRFRGGDGLASRYELADGSAIIVVPNDIHVRLIEQLKKPPVFEIIAPMTHVVVESGAVPSTYQIRRGHSYYRDLEARYVPLQLADLFCSITENRSNQEYQDERAAPQRCLLTLFHGRNSPQLGIAEAYPLLPSDDNRIRSAQHPHGLET